MKEFNHELLKQHMSLNSDTTAKWITEIANAGGVRAKDPILEMNKRFPVWSTEIVSYEEKENRMECIVSLYLPGIVKTGRSYLRINQYTKDKDYKNLHKEAIYNAIEQIGIYKEEEAKEDEKTEKSNATQDPQAFSSQSNQTPTPQVQATPTNITPATSEAPMAHTNSAPTLQPTAPPIHPQHNPQASAGKSNFRADQIQFVKNLKQTNHITSDEMLIRTFAPWKPSITTVNQIYTMSEQDMDQFINWFTNAGPLAL